MNCTDLVSAGVGHNCGYRTSRRILNEGVRLGYYIMTIYIPELQVQEELVQLYCRGCGLQLRQERTANKTSLVKHRRSMRVEVFRVVGIKFMDFRDVMPCSRRIRSQVAINDNIEMDEVKRLWKFILTDPVGRFRAVR